MTWHGPILEGTLLQISNFSKLRLARGLARAAAQDWSFVTRVTFESAECWALRRYTQCTTYCFTIFHPWLSYIYIYVIIMSVVKFGQETTGWVVTASFDFNEILRMWKMHLLAVHQQQLPLGQNRWWIRCFLQVASSNFTTSFVAMSCFPHKVKQLKQLKTEVRTWEKWVMRSDEV